MRHGLFYKSLCFLCMYYNTIYNYNIHVLPGPLMLDEMQNAGYGILVADIVVLDPLVHLWTPWTPLASNLTSCSRLHPILHKSCQQRQRAITSAKLPPSMLWFRGYTSLFWALTLCNYIKLDMLIFLDCKMKERKPARPCLILVVSTIRSHS